ncbi:MAG: hypothetical protein JW981_01110 [Anaerolineae bacterium]|nr:hypothetical protein [Anaerolineae bacterium]
MLITYQLGPRRARRKNLRCRRKKPRGVSGGIGRIGSRGGRAIRGWEPLRGG